MYYLGIDWGKSKCGIAIADKENKIASFYKKVSETDLHKVLLDFIGKERVEGIIVGYHSDLIINSGFKKFLEKLRDFDIPVELEGEEFSTQIAKKNLIQKGQKNIGKVDDLEASRIILQSWLDKKK